MTESGMTLRRRIELAYFRARGYFPIQLYGTNYKFQPEDRKFWRKVAAGNWEPHTFRILNSFLDRSSVYVDLGAWIGPTVIFAAARCRQVYCFEPDPFAYEHLLANLRLNEIDNVTSFHGAIYTRNGSIRLGNPEGSFGNSETSIISDTSEGITSPCLTFDHARELFSMGAIDLIKIDIEGAEFELLPNMESYLDTDKPSLYLSTHAPLFDKADRREKMQVIAELADRYSSCLDRNLQPLKRDDLFSAQYIDNFCDIILTEKNIS
jgi:FkbM family methyltransferase